MLKKSFVVAAIVDTRNIYLYIQNVTEANLFGQMASDMPLSVLKELRR